MRRQNGFSTATRSSTAISRPSTHVVVRPNSGLSYRWVMRQKRSKPAANRRLEGRYASGLKGLVRRSRCAAATVFHGASQALAHLMQRVQQSTTS